MTDALFPVAGDMATLAGWFAAFVAWGIGLSVVFWTLGYLVWFIIQFFK